MNGEKSPTFKAPKLGKYYSWLILITLLKVEDGIPRVEFSSISSFDSNYLLLAYQL